MAAKLKISEEALIKLLKEQQRSGIELLYDHYSAALYGTIFKIIGNDELAEDVLQDCFLKIWHNINSYDPQKGRLYTWMLNVARNLAIDKVRSKSFNNQQKNRDIDLFVNQLDNMNAVNFNPDTIGIKQLVQKLEPEYKVLIEILFFGGYSQTEAAEKLGIPLGTVKTRSRAAIMRLRTLFEREDHHG
ncbi:MAG: hypothetical protein RIQ89_2012 [Bacteroidota bacterium]|jgi:RNA polymerase sigma-70 factor (ECF subfamily)